MMGAPAYTLCILVPSNVPWVCFKSWDRIWHPKIWKRSDARRYLAICKASSGNDIPSSSSPKFLGFILSSESA
jgi:hypothetical protein